MLYIWLLFISCTGTWVVEIVVDPVNNLIYFGYTGIHTMNPDGTNITTLIAPIPTDDLDSLRMSEFVIDPAQR